MSNLDELKGYIDAGSVNDVRQYLSKIDVASRAQLFEYDDSQDTQTILHYAARKKDINIDILWMLLEQAQNEDINALDISGRTPLYHAVLSNNSEAVKTLIAFNADVNAKDNNGSTPHQLTLNNNQNDIAEILHEAKSKSDENQRTPVKAPFQNQYYIRRIVNTYSIYINTAALQKLIANLGDLQKQLATNSNSSCEISTEKLNETINKLNDLVLLYNESISHMEDYQLYYKTSQQLFSDAAGIVDAQFDMESPSEIQSIISDYKNNLKPLLTDAGMCNGLSAWWEYKMSEGQVDVFYNTIERITDCHLEFNNQYFVDTNIMLENELSFEKLLTHIQWLQMGSPAVTNIIPHTDQDDLATTLEVNRKYNIKGCHFDAESLAKLLELIPSDHMIHIGSKTHALGAYKKGNMLYLYDSNFKSGKAKEYHLPDELHDLSNQIIRSVSTRGYLETDVGISVFQNPGMAENQYQSSEQQDLNSNDQLLQLISSCKSNAKQLGMLRIAVDCLSSCTINDLKMITGENDISKITQRLESENILDYCLKPAKLFSATPRNLNFMISLLQLDGELKFSQPIKDNLLNKINQKIEVNPNLSKDYAIALSRLRNERSNQTETKTHTEQKVAPKSQGKSTDAEHDTPKKLSAKEMVRNYEERIESIRKGRSDQSPEEPTTQRRGPR